VVPNEEANMRRLALAIGFALVVAARSSPARATPPAWPAPLPASASVSAPAPAPAPAAATSLPPAPAPAPVGLAVVALAGATDAAWPLAREVYAAPSLRPTSMDEPRARTLCGEAVASDAPQEVRDLADTVAALRGDDAPSRTLLGDIARRFSVRAVLVVRIDGGHPTAHAFLADTGSFDAAIYAPDDAPSSSWSAATRSLVRAFGSEGPPVAPRVLGLASREGRAVDAAPPHHRQFYESGWFWGALGAAAFAGGAVFLATRDSSASAIHLHLEVPH
jgi:hypothetical protein